MMPSDSPQLGPQSAAAGLRPLKSSADIGSVTGGGLVVPISPYQEGLWLAYELEPDGNADNVCSAFRLCGCLDMDALNEALLGVLRNHGLLRATFYANENEVLQLINPPGGLPLTLADL